MNRHRRAAPLTLALIAGLAVLALHASAVSARPLATTGSNSWAATATMSIPRTHLTATTLADGRVLVVSDSTAELYDPAKGTWSPAGTLNQPRRLMSPCALSTARARRRRRPVHRDRRAVRPGDRP